MDDFMAQCQRLLESEENDVNTRGWRQNNQVFAWMMHAVNETSKDVEIRITGSSVEGGKHIWADDIGDTDIIVSGKRPEDIVDLSLLEDIPNHTGFVKLKHDGGYLKTISLKESIPPGVDAVIHYFENAINTDGSFMVTENAGSPATQINFLSKLSPLSSQWDNMGEVSGADFTLCKNMLRIFFRDKPAEERERLIEEIVETVKKSVSAQPRGDVNTMRQLFGNMILSVAEKFQSLQNGNITSQESQRSLATQSATEQTQLSQTATEQAEPSQQPATEQAEPSQQPATEPPGPSPTPTEIAQPSNQDATKQTQPSQQPATEQAVSVSPTSTEQAQPKQHATEQSGSSPPPSTGQAQPSKEPTTDKTWLAQSATDHLQATPQSATKQPQSSTTEQVQQSNEQPEIPGVSTDSSKQKLENYIINRMTGKLFDAKNLKEKTSINENESIRKVGVDLVRAKKISGWPSIAKEFHIRANRIYPTREVLVKILYSSVYIVGKEPVEISEKDKGYCFRYSFSHPEQILFQEMGEVPRLCYRIMKIIHHAMFKKLCDGENPFKSYHIKTLLFWALEANEEEMWKVENLQECIGMLLTNLMPALIDRKLEHYFIRDINLFEHFTSEHVEEMLQCVLSILEDVPGTLNKVEREFFEKSKMVSQQTDDLPNSDNPQSSNDSSFATFYERWSKAYDEITTQFIQVVLSPNQETTKQFPSELVALFKQGNMSKENLVKVFTTFKMTSYQKHAFNSCDVRRPISNVIMDDIASVGKLLKWVLQKPIERLTNELASDENLNQEMLTDIGDNDPAALEAIDAVLPDSNEIMNTFMNFMDFK